MKLGKWFVFTALFGLVFCALAASASAAVLVNDTWLDGERYNPGGPLFVPAPPPYAENNGVVGNDADLDGDLESAWFRGGTGTLDPVAAGGPLRADIAGTSSASWTTYFTGTEGSEAQLVNVGDKLKITWNFSLSGVNASNGSQALRIAVVDSPFRIVANGTPSAGAYLGYAAFGNMGQTLNHSRPWDFMTRNGAGDLLSASGAWTSQAAIADGTLGNPGYANNVQYTFSYTAELLAGNDLEITMRMDGAGLDGVGKNYLESVYVDTNPATLKFDTFAVRPSQAVQTATQWNTSLFRVELIAVPEPASLALFGMGALAMFVRRR